MNRIALFCLFGFVVGGSGCTSVDSPAPIGEKPVKLQAAEWNGTWVSNTRALVARVLDAGQGVVEVAWIEEDNNELVMKKFTGHIRKTGDWVFGNVKSPDKPDRFLWGRLKHDGQEATLWIPDFEKIKALVKDGTLPGTVDNGVVHLGKLSADQLKYLTSGDKGVLYDWENPICFHKWSEK